MLLLRCLQCALALRAEVRLIVFQALLCLLTRLTLAQLLGVGFTRLLCRTRMSLLTATLTGCLGLSVGACNKGRDEDDWQYSHDFPLFWLRFCVDLPGTPPGRLRKNPNSIGADA